MIGDRVETKYYTISIFQRSFAGTIVVGVVINLISLPNFTNNAFVIFSPFLKFNKTIFRFIRPGVEVHQRTSERSYRKRAMIETVINNQHILCLYNRG